MSPPEEYPEDFPGPTPEAVAYEEFAASQGFDIPEMPMISQGQWFLNVHGGIIHVSVRFIPDPKRKQ